MGGEGYTATVRVGASACGKSLWMSDSGVVCKFVSGVGLAVSVIVTSGVQGAV